MAGNSIRTWNWEVYLIFGSIEVANTQTEESHSWRIIVDYKYAHQYIIELSFPHAYNENAYGRQICSTHICFTSEMASDEIFTNTYLFRTGWENIFKLYSNLTADSYNHIY